METYIVPRRFADSVKGTWTLTVADHFAGNTGKWVAWSLSARGVPASQPVQVVAGGSARVVARLLSAATPLGAPELFAGETLTIGNSFYDGKGVTIEPFTFTAGSTEVDVPLVAAADAMSGALMARPPALVNAVFESFPLLRSRFCRGSSPWCLRRR